jgi:hypothetical protein
MQEQIIYQHAIEQPLKFLFQRTVEINLNRRTTKKGRFILYKISNHNIEISLEQPGQRWEIEPLVIPYPFEFVHNKASRIITLSYHVKSLFTYPAQFDLATQIAASLRCNKVLNNTIRIKYE